MNVTRAISTRDGRTYAVMGLDFAVPGSGRTVVERVGHRRRDHVATLAEIATMPPELAMLLFNIGLHRVGEVVPTDGEWVLYRPAAPARCSRTALGSGVVTVDGEPR